MKSAALPPAGRRGRSLTDQLADDAAHGRDRLIPQRVDLPGHALGQGPGSGQDCGGSR